MNVGRAWSLLGAFRRTRLRLRRGGAARPAAAQDGGQGRDELPDLTAGLWASRTKELNETGMRTIARRLPSMIAQWVRTALPSPALVAGATALRAGSQAAAGRTQG